MFGKVRHLTVTAKDCCNIRHQCRTHRTQLTVYFPGVKHAPEAKDNVECPAKNSNKIMDNDLG